MVAKIHEKQELTMYLYLSKMIIFSNLISRRLSNISENPISLNSINLIYKMEVSISFPGALNHLSNSFIVRNKIYWR